jgi:hypothetical protein
MSPELDPPAVTQPTLPPPRVEPIKAPLPAQAQNRLKMFGIAGVGFALAAVWALHGREHEAPAHAAKSLPHVAAEVVFANAASPAAANQADVPCTELEGAIPTFVYSTWAPNDVVAADANFFVGGSTRDEMPGRIADAARVAIVRTVGVTQPQAAGGAPTPGRYEGELTVVDTATGARVCSTRVTTWSSASLVEPGISERVLKDDFAERVRSAVSEAAARLHVTLDL